MHSSARERSTGADEATLCLLLAETSTEHATRQQDMNGGRETAWQRTADQDWIDFVFDKAGRQLDAKV